MAEEAGAGDADADPASLAEAAEPTEQAEVAAEPALAPAEETEIGGVKAPAEEEAAVGKADDEALPSDEAAAGDPVAGSLAPPEGSEEAIFSANAAPNADADVAGSLAPAEGLEQEATTAPAAAEADVAGSVPPEEGLAPPEEGLAPPEEAPAPPQEGVAPPEEGLAPPEQGLAPPEEGLAPPEEGLAPPEGGLAPPEEGVAPPEEGVAPPEEGVRPPEEGLAPPEEGVASPAPAEASGPYDQTAMPAGADAALAPGDAVGSLAPPEGFDEAVGGSSAPAAVAADVDATGVIAPPEDMSQATAAGLDAAGGDALGLGEAVAQQMTAQEDEGFNDAPRAPEGVDFATQLAPGAHSHGGPSAQQATNLDLGGAQVGSGDTSGVPQVMPEEWALEDETADLATYLDDRILVSSYMDAMRTASLKPNYLVERCLHYAVDVRSETFYIEAPGNDPLVFTSRVSDEEMKVFARVFVGPLPFLSHLDLSYNLLTDIGIEWLARGLLGKRARSLMSLSLRGNSMGPKGCEKLCEALSQCPTLLCLDVSRNAIQKAGGIRVVELLRHKPAIEQVYLADTEADIDVLVALASSLLLGRSNLKVCDLENPFITTLQEDHTAHLGRMLRTNTSICEVYLGKHRMRDDGVRQLVDYLLENKTLRVLDLRCNEIGAEGAKHLGLLLRSDCQLTQLNLASNRIGEKGVVVGAQAIAEALLYNRMLTCLDLNHNMLSGEALAVLGQYIDRNSTLEMLALFHNQWDQPASYTFHKIMGDTARILPLRADFVTSEVDMQIHVCLAQDFYKERR